MKRSLLFVLFSLVLAGSFFLNTYDIEKGVGFHPDEIKKAIFVEKSIQDFKHPILMLQVSRLVNAVIDLDNRDHLVVLGRVINAVLLVGIVGVMYGMSRLTMGRVESLLVAAAVAASPILVVHAHYFKEDVLFTFTALVTLWLFLKNNALWGVALGLALSSHYKSALLVPLLGIFSIHKKSFTVFVPVLVAAGAVFIAVNHPLIPMWDTFQEGFVHEVEHASTGHDGGGVTAGTFHFTQSLMPGMTPVVAVLALLAMVYLLTQWKTVSRVDRVLLMFAALYYVVVEVSPLKPPPDYARYVIPIVPVLIYFVFRSFSIIRQQLSVVQQRTGLIILILCAVIIPLVDTVRYDYYLAHDTRVELQELLEEKGIQQQEVSYEAYSSLRVDEVKIWSHYMTAHNIDEFQAKGITYIIVNSFQYERFPEGSDEYEGYMQLFEFPYIEIQPAFKSIGFSNPTIRVVDVSNEG